MLFAARFARSRPRAQPRQRSIDMLPRRTLHSPGRLSAIFPSMRSPARAEDDFIAYTWDHFIRTGDDRWPARLPMTKSAVRGMDTVTAFTMSPEGGSYPVRRFVVCGASKRGWTTWATAAVDKRVIAIAPAVIDLLNVEPSFVHHWQAYGAWSEAVKDYVEQGLMERVGTSEFHTLMRIEEPYEYRDRLT